MLPTFPPELLKRATGPGMQVLVTRSRMPLAGGPRGPSGKQNGAYSGLGGPLVEPCDFGAAAAGPAASRFSSWGRFDRRCRALMQIGYRKQRARCTRTPL